MFWIIYSICVVILGLIFLFCADSNDTESCFLVKLREKDQHILDAWRINTYGQLIIIVMCVILPVINILALILLTGLNIISFIEWSMKTPIKRKNKS